MAAPFYNAIKGTTAGTPGTGSFTPNAASSGFIAWSTVGSGWIGLVRYEDGSAWELSYSYWDGTALSRASTQMAASSSGSALSLTSAATAALVVDGNDISPNLGGHKWGLWTPIPSASTPSAVGLPAVTATGTSAGVALTSTSYITEQPRTQYTSATTASAQAGVSSTTGQAYYRTSTGRGGFEMVTTFGATTLPTAPRVFCGLTTATYVGSTAEPSALVASFAALTLDSTDTNIQFTTSAAGSPTKTDTGIPLAVNGWYKAWISSPPTGGSIACLLARMDTGAIWYANRTTGLPGTGVLLFPQSLGGLNGTNTGTAFVMQFGGLALRTGG